MRIIRKSIMLLIVLLMLGGVTLNTTRQDAAKASRNEPPCPPICPSR